MVVEISRREALNNIIRFKDNLSEKRRAAASQPPQIHKRSYSALINRHTGDIRFSQRIDMLEKHLPKTNKQEGVYEDWRDIYLIVEDGRGIIHFDLNDAKGSSLRPAEFDALAWRIALETIEAMNALAEEFRSASGEILPEDSILRDLSQIHVSAHGLRVEELDCWNPNLSRVEAERALSNQEIGSYLMRSSGPVAQSAVFWLGETNDLLLNAYMLDVRREEERIAEHLLLQTPRGWVILSDEPDLNSSHYRYYPTIRVLLHALRDYAKTPILGTIPNVTQKSDLG